MKGFRFYAKRNGSRECFAVYTEVDPLDFFECHGFAGYEGLGATFYHENSDVAWTAISVEYLRDNYRRVSEAKAREIHPALFAFLDA